LGSCTLAAAGIGYLLDDSRIFRRRRIITARSHHVREASEDQSRQFQLWLERFGQGSKYAVLLDADSMSPRAGRHLALARSPKTGNGDLSPIEQSRSHSSLPLRSGELDPASI